MRRSKRKASKNTTTATASAAAVPAVTISDLPNHITCDILSRLPLNSIFACKRVCKTWCGLTLEPYFAKLHLSRSPLSLISYHNGNDNNNSPSSHFEILQLHDPLVLDRRDATMKFRTEFFFPRMCVVASCNGSILLSNSFLNDYRIIIVCNPLRAQHFILPKPPKLALQTDKYSVQLGFGHSPRTDQYKVLRFSRMYTPARLYLCLDIFTIGTDDEWRSIVGTEQPPGIMISNFVFLNGALHWLALEKARFICYFDIEKEQFGSFPFPSEIGKFRFYHLGVVDNRLYLHNEHESGVWRFWAMKDYGDVESWTLEWIIEEPIIYTFKGSVKPLKMLKDGSLLMMFNKTILQTGVIKTTLACYNPKTRVLRKIKYHVILSWSPSVADIPCFFSPMDALK